MEKNKYHTPISYIQINSREMIDLRIKINIIRIPEESMKVQIYLHDLVKAKISYRKR